MFHNASVYIIAKKAIGEYAQFFKFGILSNGLNPFCRQEPHKHLNHLLQLNVGGVRRMQNEIRHMEHEFYSFRQQLEDALQASKSAFPERLWRNKIANFINGEETELIFREKDQVKHAESLKKLCQEKSLYCQQYHKVVVISKLPLPNYREDLDDKKPQRVVSIPDSILSKVDYHLREYEHFLPRHRLSSPLQEETGNGAESVPEPLSSDSRNRESNDVWKSERMKADQTDWMRSEDGLRMARVREKLPAFQERANFLKLVRENQVVVVSGETGCGKTTQLPQYILESEIDNVRGAQCSIICTQPRRISATSVSERIAAERGEEIGETVGYQVRLDGKKNRSTRLLFCTTGILLRRLSFDPLLQGVSHVVVDEIHERGMNEDFLLIVLRDLLPKRPDFRLILMSATLNAELFSKYFGNAPSLSIPGFTHPVRTFFLEDVLERTGYAITPQNQIDDYGSDKKWRMSKQVEALRKRKQSNASTPVEDLVAMADLSSFSKATQESLRNWTGETCNFNLIESTLYHIAKFEAEGSVLVFLTGWDDIRALLEKLRANHFLGNPKRALLLGCHSGMASADQRLIFKAAPPGVRKIVLATNIAETSITIDDCVYVVDLGKAKETSYDVLNNTPCLLPAWISKASAKQRRGRAGRVRPGVCFHLYPKPVHDNFPDFGDPELLRTPLQSLCLQIKSLNLGSVAAFLGKALQPPDPKAVANAVELLEDMGALTKGEKLTALGRHLSALPLDPSVGKMLCMGAILGCLDPLLTVAAALADRDPWMAPMDKKEVAEECRLFLSGREHSDHLAVVRVFDQWRNLLSIDQGLARDFCYYNFVSWQTLTAMAALREQFQRNLVSSGLIPEYDRSEARNSHSADKDMVKGAILAGLWPGVALCMRKQKSTVFKTKEDGQINLHGSSLNSKDPDFPYPWLAFSEKVKTRSVFIRDSTGMSDMAVLLFGGRLERGREEGHLTMRDGYLEFFFSPQTARVLLNLRKHWDSLLQRKMQDTEFDLHKTGAPILEAVKLLLHCREVQGSFVVGRGRQSSPNSKLPPGGQDPKTRLLNYCSKNRMARPEFVCSEARDRRKQPPTFTATVAVEVGRYPVQVQTFVGQPARSKKLAEASAAAKAMDSILPGQSVHGRDEERAPRSRERSPAGRWGRRRGTGGQADSSPHR